MKILFLDIDGVLITHKSKNAHTADPNCVIALQKIIDQINPLIVVSSSWKNIHGINPQEMLTRFGLSNFRFGGQTPTLHENTCRGDEIQQWFTNLLIDNNKCSIVILDDQNDMVEFLPCLIQTSFKDGFTIDHADRTIRMFRGH